MTKIIEGTRDSLYLSADSRYNCVLYSDVADFIQYATEHDIQGTYNVASSSHIQLSEIANLLGSKMRFGNYKYDSGNISNRKICSVFPRFTKTSREVFQSFARERKDSDKNSTVPSR